jgi:hypothetical protein
VFYVLEFYATVGGEEKKRLKRITHIAPSVEDAVKYAKAMLRYTTMEDKKPDQSLVKSQSGKVLDVVRRR